MRAASGALLPADTRRSASTLCVAQSGSSASGPVPRHRRQRRSREQADGAQDAAGGYSTEKADALKGRTFDVNAIAGRGRRYEELDQLVTELLLGAR